MADLPTLTGLRTAPEFQEADSDTQLQYYDKWATAQRDRANAQGLVGPALNNVDLFLQDQRDALEFDQRSEKYLSPGFFDSIGNAIVRGTSNAVADVQGVRANQAIAEQDELGEERSREVTPLLETLQQDESYQSKIRKNQIEMAQELLLPYAETSESAKTALTELEARKQQILPPSAPRPETVAAMNKLDEIETTFSQEFGEQQESAEERAASSLRAREIGSFIPASEKLQEYHESEDVWAALDVLVENPSVAVEIAAESAPSVMAPIVAGALGTVATGNPVGGAVSAASGGFGVEVSASYMQFLAEESGLEKFETGEQLLNAMRDPAIVSKARSRAVARGIPIAVVDAISLGIGSSLMKIANKSASDVVGKTAVRTALKQGAIKGGAVVAGGTIDAGAGAAGELGAQVASGQEVDGKEILSEAIGQIVTGVGMQAAESASKAGSAVNAVSPDVAGVEGIADTSYENIDFGIADNSREEPSPAGASTPAVAAPESTEFLKPIADDFTTIVEREIEEEVGTGGLEEDDPEEEVGPTPKEVLREIRETRGEDPTLSPPPSDPVEPAEVAQPSETEPDTPEPLDDDWVPFPEPEAGATVPADEYVAPNFSSDVAVPTVDRLTALQEEQLNALLALDDDGKRAYLEGNRVPDTVLDAVVEDADSEAIYDEIERRAQEDVVTDLDEFEDTNTETLDEAIAAIGGLLTPRVARERGDPLAGEFEQIQKESKTRIGRFNNTGKPIDQATELLRERGFDFETPNELVNALIAHDRGQTVRSNPGLTAVDADGNVFSPRNAEPEQQKLDELTAFLRRELARDSRVDPETARRVRATRFGQPVESTGRGKEFAAAERLARLFGRRTVVVSDLPSNGLVNRQDNDHIYLADDSDRSPFLVANHELIHQLKNNEPELYAELEAAVEADLQEWVAEQRPGLGNESLAIQKEELLADYLAEMSGSVGFWDKLAEKNPSLFKRVVDYIRDFFAKIHRQALINDVDVTPFLKDAARARDAMEQALTKWAAKERLQVLGIRSLEEGQADTDADSDNRFMPRAIKDAQQVYGNQTGRSDEIQGHEERQSVVRERFFDGRQPFSVEATTQAYRVMNEVLQGKIDPRAATGLDGANQQLKNELFAYARTLVKMGDSSMLKMIESYGNDFFNREATVAGRVLNAIGQEVSAMQGHLQAKEEAKDTAVDDIRPGTEPGTKQKFSELVNALETELGQETVENLTEDEIATIIRAIKGEEAETKPKRKRKQKVKTQREIRRGLVSDENRSKVDEITDLVDSAFESENMFSDLRSASPLEKKAALDVIVTNQISTGRRSEQQFLDAVAAVGLSEEKAGTIFQKVSELRESEGKKAHQKRKKRRERNPAELLAAEADAESTRVDRINERVRKLSDRLRNPRDAEKRKPDDLRQTVNGQLGDSRLEEVDFVRQLRKLGVNREEATSLFEALEAERVKRAEIEQLKKEVAAAEEKTLEQVQAERLISSLAQSQSDTQTNAPRKVPVNRVREMYQSILAFGPVMSDGRFVQDLGALGVEADASTMLYRLAMKERANREAFSRTRSADQAIEKSMSFLIRELLANPLLQMVGPNERHQIAVRLFMENGGLSRPHAASAARAFDKIFVEKLASARIELANRWIKRRNPAMKFDAPMTRRKSPTLSDRIRKAVRAGVMDPRLRFSEELARDNGWSDFTTSEVERLAILDEKLEAENLTDMEATTYKQEMFDIVRQSNSDPGFQEAVSSYYLANIFSGVKTHLLATSSLSRVAGRAFFIDPIAAAIGSGTKSSEIRFEAWLDAIGGVLGHLESGLRSGVFTLKTGNVRGKIENESILGIDSLRQLHDSAMRTFANPESSGAAKAKAGIKLVMAFSRWNFRAMSGADSAIQTLLREYDKRFLSSSRAMAAGMTIPQVRALRNEVYRMTPVFESEGRAKGFKGNDLAIYVSDRTSMAIFDGLEGKGVDLTEVAEQSQREASMATGVKEIEGGFLKVVAEAAVDVSNKGGILGRLAVPVVRTPYNIFHDSAWLSPWGFKRILKTAIRTKGFKDWEKSEYPVSLGTPRQIMLRSVESAVGTAIQAALWGLLALNEDLEEEEKFFRINLGGPSMRNSTEWQAWRETGHRPYTFQFRFPGSKAWASQGFRMGGLEPLNFAATIVGSWDQMKYNAAGKAMEEEWQAYAATLMQEMTGESMFFMRGLSRGPGVSKDSLGREAGFRASGLVPYSGLLKTASKFENFKETDGFQEALLMQMPVIPLVSGQERLNALGDPLGGVDRNSAFDVQARLGMPTGFVIEGKGDKSDVYELLSLKKRFPSEPSRKSLGDITMSEYYRFVKLRGSMLTSAIRKDRKKLLAMSEEDFKDWLSLESSKATKAAKKKLSL